MSTQKMIWDIAVTRQFRQGKQVFELSVQFNSPSKRLALFGPSGAGKTVTLKIIAGLMRPDSGHIRIEGAHFFDGSTALDVPVQQRNLAFVFQDYALFPHLNVRQNIAFGLRHGWRNPSPAPDADTVNQWIENFGLQSVQQHYPEQLSGGQRQRTALARALILNPSALLLDEPFAALDKALRRHLRDELADLQQQLDIPMLLITHNEDDAQHLSDQIINIEQGHIVSIV